MVKVTYEPKKFRLVASGHAEAGPRGQDLVCAAVSALTLTLGANVADLASDGKVTRQVLQLKDGDCFISCVPSEKMKPVVRLIFDAVCAGFQLLETLYPENIRYDIH